MLKQVQPLFFLCQLSGLTGLSIPLTDVIAGLDPAIQVYNLANCFTWMPHQVRREIRDGVRRRDVRGDIGDEGRRRDVRGDIVRKAEHPLVVLDNQSVVLNSFQDLKK